METSKVAPPQHSSEKAEASTEFAMWAPEKRASVKGQDGEKSRRPFTRSSVRTRVAKRDWWASRMVVSVRRTRVCCRAQEAKASGP
jgi:hypothetical protein